MSRRKKEPTKETNSHDEEDADFVCFVRTAFLLQQFMQCWGGASVGGFFSEDTVSLEKNVERLVLFLVVAAALTGWKSIFSLSVMCRWWLRWRYMPFMWESEIWTIMHEVCLVLYAMRLMSWQKAVATIQYQSLVFYAAAALWKYNTSFLDHRTSCGSIFIAQILTVLRIPIERFTTFWNLAILSAPISSAMVETVIPILLWLVPDQGGLLSALLFHLLIVFCEPPNNAGGFSVSALRWLFFFAAPGTVRKACSEVFTVIISPTLVTTIILLAAAVKAASHPFFFDTAVPIYCLLFPLLCQAALMQKSSNKLSMNKASLFGLLLAFVYGFILPALGLIDQMSPNMFANQRFHGGSNHLLFPTGILHEYMPKDLWAVVRVRSIEPALKTHPAEVTTALTPAVRAVLARAGHSGRQFNPMLSRVVGIQAIPPPPGDLPQAAFTLVAWEFRRLLAETPAPYNLTFSLLDGLSGDESWRRGLDTKDVTLTKSTEESPAVCSEPKSDACILAGLPPPPKFLTKLAAFTPLPIFLNEDNSSMEVYCFGP